MDSASTKHTCLKLQIPQSLFIKASEEEVDQPVSDYIHMSQQYLRFQQPGRRCHENKSNEKLKSEAEKCLAQSEKFQTAKAEFETTIYSKFLGVLNSKKAKLRELGDQPSNQEQPTEKLQEDEEDSTDKTETFDGDTEHSWQRKTMP